MAHTTTGARAGFSISGLFRAIGASLYTALIRMAEARSRTQRFQHLQSLSDEELHQRGLTRERIAYHVFADSIWR
ncbi:DUF1127 domain-containing protein [Ruegeria meonggei]|uniref:DUF1127 domain-containing protein n=1 Tax=Ruegeria meonggei TaxID=1446476 RepID=UPI00366C36AA